MSSPDQTVRNIGEAPAELQFRPDSARRLHMTACYFFFGAAAAGLASISVATIL